ncbi:hypothetical protein PGB90_003078 [Kerria lacca]
MNKKESRWAAAQARIRTEMKQLKDHNTTLKEEAILMVAALFSIIFSGLSKFGNFRNIIEIAERNNRIDFMNFRSDLTVRHTWLSTLIGGTFNGLFLKAINQVRIQRYLTMKDYKSVVFSVLFSWPFYTLLSFTICFCGLIIFANYEHCDSISTKRISSPDQLLPLYVLETFRGSGLAGVIVSGIFSASLSSLSPLLNSLAAVTLENYIKPLVKNCKNCKLETSSSVISQILAGMYGIICILFSLLALKIKSIMETSLTLFGIVGGPLVGVYSLGMFSPTPNEMETIIGFIAGILSCTWISIGQPRPKPTFLSLRTDGCNILILSKYDVYCERSNDSLLLTQLGIC